MRNLLCTILLVALGYYSLAQKTTWSKKLEDNNRFSYLKILGTAENGFYFLRSNGSFDEYSDFSNFRSRRYLLQYLNSELLPVWEKEITPSIDNAKILDIQSVGTRVLIISYNDKENGVGYQVHGEFLNATGNLAAPPVLIEEFPFTRFDDERKPGVIFSKDRSKWAFTYRKEAGLAQTLCAVVLDTAMNRIYRQEWDINAPLKRYAPTHFLLTNTGDFYVLGIQYLTDKRIKSPGESFFNLSGYNQHLHQIIRHDIQIDNKFLTDISIATDPVNRRLVAAGFYSEIGMLATAGIFYSAFSEDSLTETTVYTAPFSNELMQKAITDRSDFRKKELFNYYVDRLVLRKDGGAAVIAESYVETSRTFWDYYTQSMITHNYYRYGNILSASFNPSGGLLWDRIIPKEQNSMDDEGYQSSYVNMVSGGKFYVIFNKFIERNSSVMICSIDGQGVQKTDVLFGESERVSIVAKAARQVDASTVLIPAYKQGNLYIAKIQLQ